MRRKVIFSALFGVCIFSTLAWGQVTEEWVARYNGPANSYDGARAIAADGSGNVYVTGYSIGSGSYDGDFATIKYLPNGDTSWVRRYNGSGNGEDIARALAVDDSGNVYVTGESYAISLDTVPVSGSSAASATSSGMQPLQDSLVFRAYSPVDMIVTDPNGDSIGISFNTILNGSAYNVSNDSVSIPHPIVGNYRVRVVLDTFDLSGDTSYTLGVRIDGKDQLVLASNVPVPEAGESDNYHVIYYLSVDYLTIKYAPNGDTLWVRSYNGPGKFADRANALALDTSGNVYVTGYSYGSFGDITTVDYATIKYLPNGDTAWVRRYNGPVNDFDLATALAIDGSGNVHVTGVSIGGGSSQDYATIKYLPNGDTAWIRRYNGPGNDFDAARALSIDGSGNVYVTGGSSGTGSSNDYATIKYLPNGDTAWVRSYNGSGNLYDEARALAVDGSGNVYVTGSSYPFYATIKYHANGDTAWVRRYSGPGFGENHALALAMDNAGNVYVTGYSRGSGSYYDYATIKYKPNGDSAWVRRYNGPYNGVDQALALAVDDSGNVYVTGESDGHFSLLTDYATIKYSPCSQPGNYNTDGKVTVIDLVYLVNILFKGWAIPGPTCMADVNADSSVSFADIIYLARHVFKFGPAPVVSGVCCP